MQFHKLRLKSSDNYTDNMDFCFCNFADANINIFIIGHRAIAPLHSLKHVPF
jgi:hypothetical protein